MKQSGIDWIGEIPDDWKINQLSQIVSQVKNKNTGLKENNLLSLSYGKIKRKNINTNDGLLPASFDGYNIISDGDIVLRLTDLQNDHTSLRVGRATEQGIITSAYTTLHPVDYDNSKYLYYILHSFDLKKGFYGMGSGVRQGLNYDEVKTLKVPLPPKATQQSIAEYLDKKITEIDTIIEESKKSIEEYKAWKQSVIFEAVTGNLKTESRKLKDETFTDKWQLIKIKYVAEYNTETLPENTKDEFNFNYIDIGSVKFGEGITNFQNMIFKDAPSRARRIVKKDDVIISSVRTYLRAIARIEKSEIPQIASTGFVVFSSKPQKILPRFLFYAISSESFVGKVEANSVGISYPAINASQIANFKIPLPPLPEQESIAKMLDSKCAQIDSLITEKESLIADLTEYKKSLIFEVVTGKRSI